MTSSDTETLDHVFTTPADGRFTIECDAQGASARVGRAAANWYPDPYEIARSRYWDGQTWTSYTAD